LIKGRTAVAPNHNVPPPEMPWIVIMFPQPTADHFVKALYQMSSYHLAFFVVYPFFEQLINNHSNPSPENFQEILTKFSPPIII
jgi:hypothetical protein